MAYIKLILLVIFCCIANIGLTQTNTLEFDSFEADRQAFFILDSIVCGENVTHNHINDIHFEHVSLKLYPQDNTKNVDTIAIHFYSDFFELQFVDLFLKNKLPCLLKWYTTGKLTYNTLVWADSASIEPIEDRYIFASANVREALKPVTQTNFKDTIAQRTQSKFEEGFANFLNKNKNKVSLYDSLINTQLLLEIEKNNYLRSAIIHRRSTFDWQYKSGIIIFYMVIFIVLTGLIISGMHFYKSLKIPSKKQNQAAAEQSELEFSLSGGIKLKSSLIGIIILITSLAFLYLYLIYVYPVDELLLDNNVTKAVDK